MFFNEEIKCSISSMSIYSKARMSLLLFSHWVIWVWHITCNCNTWHTDVNLIMLSHFYQKHRYKLVQQQSDPTKCLQVAATNGCCGPFWWHNVRQPMAVWHHILWPFDPGSALGQTIFMYRYFLLSPHRHACGLWRHGQAYCVMIPLTMLTSNQN